MSTCPIKLELILVEWFTHIPGVADAETVHLKDECGTPHTPFISRKPSLMDGDIIDQDIAEGRIDLVPLIPFLLLGPAGSTGFPFGESYIVVIPMLSAYGHHIGPYLGHGKPHRPKGIGDDLCPAAGCDLKKGMAEPFDLDNP